MVRGRAPEIDYFSPEALFKPFRSAGTKKNPRIRSIDEIAGALIITAKIPPKIVGAVLYQTFYDIEYNGLDLVKGQYGESGKSLINYLRNECINLMNREAAEDLAVQIMDRSSCVLKGCRMRTRKFKAPTRFKRFLFFWMVPRLNIANILIALFLGCGLYIYRDAITFYLGRL